MKISVIIPCFNAAAFVGRAVRSVVAQDYTDIEIICVDDGSTDGTRDVLQQLSVEFDGRLHVLHLANGGPGKARNAGAKAATGTYLQFLDADDELRPSKLSADVQLIRSPQPAMIAGAYTRSHHGRESKMEVKTGDVWFALFNGQLGCTCSNLFQREAFLNAGGWSELLQSSLETDLMHRLLKNNADVIYNPQFNTIVHVGDSIISVKEPVANLRRYFDVRLAVFDSMRSLGFEKGLYTNAGYMFYGILHRMYALDATQSFIMLNELRKRKIKITEGPGVSSRYRMLCTIFGFAATEKLFYRGQ